MAAETLAGAVRSLWLQGHRLSKHVQPFALQEPSVSLN